MYSTRSRRSYFTAECQIKRIEAEDCPLASARGTLPGNATQRNATQRNATQRNATQRNDGRNAEARCAIALAEPDFERTVMVLDRTPESGRTETCRSAVRQPAAPALGGDTICSAKPLSRKAERALAQIPATG
ncbi:hypothetical protein ADM96_32080 [Burkholderia sp. ST111]|nr:hypothetical protein ADM96_32080 [Burkholderia sp. ST111]